jgi:L-asparaginase II
MSGFIDHLKGVMTAQPLRVERLRAGVVEAFHNVDLVMVNARGEIVAQYGDPKRPAPPRSASKLAQAVPYITTGAADAQKASEAELALICASHSGMPIHVAAINSLFDKAGVDGERDLILPPSIWEEAVKLDYARNNVTLQRAHHMCSGNHGAMLCTACHMDEERTGYYQATHAVQQRVTEAQRQLYRLDKMPEAGLDGCGIPVYAVPLVSLAFMAVAAAKPEQAAPKDMAEAVERLVRAGLNHPDMMSSPNRVEYQVMQAAAKQLYVKLGADGLMVMADRASGMGLAMRVQDGSVPVVEALTAEIVADGLGAAAPEALKKIARMEIRDPQGNLAAYTKHGLMSARGLG